MFYLSPVNFCNQSITDLMDCQDLVRTLCVLLDPIEPLWRALGSFYGITSDKLNYICYYKDPNSNPIMVNLLEMISKKTYCEEESGKIYKFLHALHGLRDKHSAAMKAIENILEWHSQCQLCREMFH